MKAPNDKIERVIDTLDNLMALKKNTQWSEIITPQKNSFKTNDLEIFGFLFKKGAKIIKHIDAINILYHTNSIESTEIKDPSIAVKPKIKTIK